MKTKLLCDILSPAQIEEIGKIIDGSAPHDRIIKLKQYLIQFRGELEKNGVDSNYLAYSVEYALTKQPQQNKGPKHGS